MVRERVAAIPRNRQRRKHLLTFLLLFLFLVLPSTVDCQSIEKEILNEIQKILKYEVSIDTSETPGFIIGIVEVDTTFVIQHGLDASKSAKIDKNAYYALGGLSKVYLALLYQDLINRNQIRDEIELQELFPSLHGTAWESVNIYQLLTHTSGIPRTLRNVNTKQVDPFEGIQLKDIFQGLHDTPSSNKSNFRYSHYNYGLLSEALKRITSMSIEQLWMNCPPCVELRPSLIISTSKKIIPEGLNKVGELTKIKDYGDMKYSLGLQASIYDLLKLIDIIRSLDESQFNITSEELSTGIDKTVKFSRGLYKLTGDKKYTVYSHSGRSNQHSAAIHYVPETKTGVVIISNSEIGTKDLSLQVLRMVNNNWKRKRIDTNE